MTQTNDTPAHPEPLNVIADPSALTMLADQVPEFPGEDEVAAALSAAKGVEAVEDNDDRELVASHATDLAKHEKAIKDHAEPYVKAAHALHKRLTTWRKGLMEPVESERKRLDDLVLAYDKAERERRAQQEAELSAEGAEVVLPDHRQPASVTGASSRTLYSAEVTDIHELIRAAAKNPEAYAQYLLPNMPALNGAARQQRDALNIPGVKLAKTEKLAHSRS